MTTRAAATCFRGGFAWHDFSAREPRKQGTRQELEVDQHMNAENASACLNVVIDSFLDSIVEEATLCQQLAVAHPGNRHGDKTPSRHPAYAREGHVQCLLFSKLRSAGHYVRAETNYCEGANANRQLDLAIWWPALSEWFFLEIEKYEPAQGYTSLVKDAQKLVQDSAGDPRNHLAGVLVYTCRAEASQELLNRRFREIGSRLATAGFRQFAIRRKEFAPGFYKCIQAGLWVVDRTESKNAFKAGNQSSVVG